MATTDKVKNTAQRAKGKVKEAGDPVWPKGDRQYS